MARSALLNVIVDAARKAGRSLNRDFGEVQNLQVSLKGPADFARQAEAKAEQALFAELSRARAGYGYLSRERGALAGSDEGNRWIVAPLSGAANFLHGLPFFAVSVALERAGQIVAGLIYNPALDELFSAERGGGAFFNDRRIRVGARTKLTDCIIGAAVPHLGQSRHGEFLVELRNVMGETAGVRGFGCAALDLASVAAGRLDGFWEKPAEPWDVAAGILLVREAGGFVSDRDGGAAMLEGGGIAAANEAIHRQLLKQLTKPLPAAR